MKKKLLFLVVFFDHLIQKTNNQVRLSAFIGAYCTAHFFLLPTAYSSEREREKGIRKHDGAGGTVLFMTSLLCLPPPPPPPAPPPPPPPPPVRDGTVY